MRTGRTSGTTREVNFYDRTWYLDVLNYEIVGNRSLYTKSNEIYISPTEAWRIRYEVVPKNPPDRDLEGLSSFSDMRFAVYKVDEVNNTVSLHRRVCIRPYVGAGDRQLSHVLRDRQLLHRDLCEKLRGRSLHPDAWKGGTVVMIPDTYRSKTKTWYLVQQVTQPEVSAGGEED